MPDLPAPETYQYRIPFLPPPPSDDLLEPPVPDRADNALENPNFEPMVSAQFERTTPSGSLTQYILGPRYKSDGG